MYSCHLFLISSASVRSVPFLSFIVAIFAWNVPLLLLLLSHFSRVWLCGPHRRQPTRLPHPWDSPGKNTGVGCHCLLQNVPLVSLIFLRRSPVFPIILFSSISLHWSLKKAFLSLCAVLWNSAFNWVYLSFSPLPFASLFSVICKTSSDNHFAFLHFFILRMVLITASCTMSWTSVHSSSSTLSHLIPWITYNHGLFICFLLPVSWTTHLHSNI